MKKTESKNIEAAKYAERSNILYDRACAAHRAFIDANQKYEIYREFVHRDPVINYTRIYFALLLVEALISGYLTRGIIKEVLQIESLALANTISTLIYVVLIYAFTTTIIKLRYLHKELAYELLLLKNWSYSPTLFESNLNQKHQKDKRISWAWISTLFLFLLSLGLYRNWVSNQGVFFNDITDYLIILLPFLITVLLLRYGMYREIFLKYHYYKVQKQRYDNHRFELRKESNEEGRKACEFYQLAKDHNEQSISMQELQSCLHRMKNQGSSEYDYFDNRPQHKLELEVFYNGEPFVKCPSSITTLEGLTYYCKTDEQGKICLKWRSFSPELKKIIVGNNLIPGERFQAGNPIQVDLAEFPGYVSLN